MASRTVVVKLVADIGGYTSQLEKANRSTSKLGDQAERSGKQHRAAWDQIGRGGAAAAVVGVAAVGAMVSSFMQFDRTMSQVQAATGATGGELGKLRDAALEAGKATVFSATEAAQAQTELSKAGVSTADILGGALTGALDLAAAGQLGVADAAGIAATAMTQFGLSGKDVPHIADLLAAGAGKAQGEVSDLAVALKYAGPVAHQMGISIEETTGVLAELASQGILADQAGTSLRGMLSALTSPSAAASGKMEELGINVYDTAGQFIGFDGVAGQLHDRLGKLTNQQRDSALGTIFGNEQITAARILYAGGAEDVQKWTKEVNDAGFAQEQAAAKLDNLSGDLEAFRGSVETALIQGGSAANGSLRLLVQTATGAVNVFAGLPGPLQATAVGMVAVTAAGGGALTFFGAVVPKVRAYRAELDGMGKAGSVANRAIGLGGRALGASLPVFAVAAAAIQVYNQRKAESAQRVKDFTEAVVADNGVLGENTRQLAVHTLEQTGALQAAQVFRLNLADVTDATLGNHAALERVNAVLDLYQREAQLAAGAGSENNASTKASDDAYTKLRDTLGTTSSEVNKAVEAARRQASAQGQQKNATDVVNAATIGYTGTVRDTTGALKQYESAADAVKASIDRLNGGTISAAESDIDFRNAVARATQSLHDNGRTLDLNTQKGRDNRSAIISAVKAAQQHAQAVADQTGSVERGVKAFNDDIAVLHRTAGGSNATRGAVDKLIDSYGRVPKSTAGAAKGLDKSSRSAETAASKMNAVTKAANSIPKSVTTRVTAVVSVVDSIEGSVRGAAVDSSITARNVTGSGPGRALGGWVPGHSPSDYADNIPATIAGKRPLWLTGDEFVINRPRARKIRQQAPGLLEGINSGQVDIGGDPGALRASYGRPLGPVSGRALGGWVDPASGPARLWSADAGQWLTEGQYAGHQDDMARQRAAVAHQRAVAALTASRQSAHMITLARQATQLARHIHRGGDVYEDLSFRGMSSYYGAGQEELADRFWSAHKGMDFGRGSNPVVFRWLQTLIRGIERSENIKRRRHGQQEMEPLRFAGGGSIPDVQAWMRAQDPKPYVYGANGPNAWDCSSFAGGALLKLRGQDPNRRIFTTDSIGSVGANYGLRPGLGKFSIGVTPSKGHMVFQVGSLKAEARSTASGIIVGAGATSPAAMARHFYLPELGGTFGLDSLSGRQKAQIFRMIRPQIAAQTMARLQGRAAGGPVAAGQLYRVNERGGEGYFVPPADGQIVPAHDMSARNVQPAGRSGDSRALLAALGRVEKALAARPPGPVMQVDRIELHDRVDVDLLADQLAFRERAGSFG